MKKNTAGEYRAEPVSAMMMPAREMALVDDPSTKALMASVAYLVQLPSTSKEVAESVSRHLMPLMLARCEEAERTREGPKEREGARAHTQISQVSSLHWHWSRARAGLAKERCGKGKD